jgi:hypothetical protein
VLGGIEEYTLELSGFLLVDAAGPYEFTLDVDPEAECFLSWHLRINQGDYVNTLLVNDWPSETGPKRASGPVRLRRGVWRIEFSIRRHALEPDGPEDLCPQRFGVTLNYSGEDTGNKRIVVPRERLFLDKRDTFSINTSDIEVPVGTQLAVLNCYVPHIQDMARTYTRCAKTCMIFAKQGISPLPVTDTRRS